MEINACEVNRGSVKANECLGIPGEVTSLEEATSAPMEDQAVGDDGGGMGEAMQRPSGSIHLRHLYNEPPYGDLFRTIKITITKTKQNIQTEPKDSWVYLSVRNKKTGP